MALACACRQHEPQRHEPEPAPPPTAAPDPVAAPSACRDDERIAAFAHGRLVDRLCPEDVAKAGLTLLDLSDRWLPSLFGEDPGLGKLGMLEYRAELSALASERFDLIPEGHRAHHDRFLELYGISPTFSVLRARLFDEERHRCHDRVPAEPLLALDEPLNAWRKLDDQRADRYSERELRERLQHGLETRGLQEFAQLRDHPRYGITYRLWQRVERRVGAIAAAQAHLRCERLLAEAEERVLDGRTLSALSAYQRKHMVVSWTLDRETAVTMANDSRVLDLKAMLRALRERVMDATGIIEDGTAIDAPGLVMGHHLDPEAFHHLADREPLAGGAPDLLSQATEAAAQALGWTSPEDARAFFERHDPAAAGLGLVALRLPPPPRYHAPHMELRAEIDRGDVWYDYPYAGSGARKLPPAKRRPVLVLYARDGERDVPLVRWGTTIGDWKPERVGKRVRLLYKESPVGPRVWRDLVVTPRWIPPASTPTRDLVVPTRDGWRVRRELVGPSYASAYGLVMLIHHRPDSTTVFTDQGVRTHGSVSYDSIHQGSSHGCHRLHNHRAVRLATFLLRHRNWVRRGAEPFPIGRSFPMNNYKVQLSFDSRGYRYQLDPPVPVEVTRGRVMGKLTRPDARAVDLPADLARRFMAEMGE